MRSVVGGLSSRCRRRRTTGAREFEFVGKVVVIVGSPSATRRDVYVSTPARVAFSRAACRESMTIIDVDAPAR